MTSKEKAMELIMEYLIVVALFELYNDVLRGESDE